MNAIVGMGEFSQKSVTGLRSTAVELRGVGRVYQRGEQVIQALENIDIVVPDGAFFTILGPSGCGKSTLLSIVAGFDRPDTGDVAVYGRPIHGPSVERSVVFQDTGALFPWLTVAQNVAFGLKSVGRKVNARDRVSDVLGFMRLSTFANHYPYQLSGGMRQLVAIARSLVMEPKLLLMDEPFAALDAITRQRLQERLIEIWQSTNITVLFITHSVEEALVLSDEVVVMSARPGTVCARLNVDLPRPRSVTSIEFNALREKALASLLSTQGEEGELQ